MREYFKTLLIIGIPTLIMIFSVIIPCLFIEYFFPSCSKTIMYIVCLTCLILVLPIMIETQLYLEEKLDNK